MAKSKKQLSKIQTEVLTGTLKTRFEKNTRRHPKIDWNLVEKRLLLNPGLMWTLNEMERTGGEPDVVGFDKKDGAFIFFDCSAESPAGRRSLCFDKQAWIDRKENKPAGSALEMANEMGAEILSEQDYRELQLHGEYDLKTSSWVQTPDKIRKWDGALFCDRRYDTVFVYHNGAQSYYAARGFRCKVVV